MDIPLRPAVIVAGPQASLIVIRPMSSRLEGHLTALADAFPSCAILSAEARRHRPRAAWGRSTP